VALPFPSRTVKKIRHLFTFALLCFGGGAFLLSSARGQTITDLYDDTDGTHYNVAHSLTGTATTTTPGLGAYLLTLFEGSTQLNHVYVGQWAWPGMTGSVSINANFVVPPTKTYRLRVAYWIYNSNDGGASSNWQISYIEGLTGDVGTGPPVSPGNVTVSLQNTSGVPVTYRLMNGTTQIGSDVTLQPGSTLTETFVLPAGVEAANLKVISRIADVTFSDGQWVVEEGAVTTQTMVSPGVITTSNIHAESATPTPAQIVPVPMPNAPSSPVTGATGGGTVWNSNTTNNSTTSTNGLTNSVFREGVDKITSRQDKQLTELRKLGKQADDLTALSDSKPSSSEMTSQGTAAKTDADSKFTGLPSASAKTATLTAPDFTISNPLFGTINADPFTSERFGPIAAWFRAAVSWFLAVLLATAVAKEAADTIKGVSAAQQAKGNPIAVGTGAQATALLAASLMTAIIIAAIVVVVALAVSDFGFGTVASIFSANPYDGIPGGVAYCLDKCFNLGHVTLYLLTLPTIPLVFAKINAGTSAAIRFVVP